MAYYTWLLRVSITKSYPASYTNDMNLPLAWYYLEILPLPSSYLFPGNRGAQTMIFMSWVLTHVVRIFFSSSLPDCADQVMFKVIPVGLHPRNWSTSERRPLVVTSSDNGVAHFLGAANPSLSDPAHRPSHVCPSSVERLHCWGPGRGVFRRPGTCHHAQRLVELCLAVQLESDGSGCWNQKEGWKQGQTLNAPWWREM